MNIIFYWKLLNRVNLDNITFTLCIHFILLKLNLGVLRSHVIFNTSIAKLWEESDRNRKTSSIFFALVFVRMLDWPPDGILKSKLLKQSQHLPEFIRNIQVKIFNLNTFFGKKHEARLTKMRKQEEVWIGIHC